MELTKKYHVYINEAPAPLEKARVSKFPFNRHWPGYQRPFDQTEVTAFTSFDVKDITSVRIECDFDFKNVIVRPLSLEIIPLVEGRTVKFEILKPCQAVVEFDGISGALHLFADPPEKYEIPAEDILYFGCGEHNVGRIELKSNQTVFIDKGAVVYGEIYATDVENVKIIGKGILDHSKATPLAEDDGFIDPPRPSPIEIRYSRNVEIKGIVVRDPCFLAVRPICCENVHIDNIKIIGNWRYNSDGIDLINCRHGIIENCFVRSFDDTYCLKGFCWPYVAQLNHNGRTYDVMEDITFRNCIAYNDWGKALEIGVDLCSAEIKNCRFENCDVIHVVYAAMDISNVDYADVHDITFDDIRVEYGETSQPPIIQVSDDAVYPCDNAEYMPLLMLGSVYFSELYSSKGEKRGKIRNIVFNNIKVTAPRMPESSFNGFSEKYGVENVKISNLFLNGEKLTDMKKANIKTEDFAKNITIE